MRNLDNMSYEEKEKYLKKLKIQNRILFIGIIIWLLIILISYIRDIIR